MKKKWVSLLLIFNLFLCNTTVFAHPGRTDSSGGHHDRSSGTYHYHNGGSSSSASAPSDSDIKKQLDEKNAQEINRLLDEYTLIENDLKNTFGILVPEYVIDKNIEFEKQKSDITSKIEFYKHLYTKRFEQIKYSEEILVYLDGVLLEAETYVKNGITYIELRKILELLHYEVTWNSETKEVLTTKDQNSYKFCIGSYVAYSNSKQLTLSAAPEITNNRTFLPVRFLREAIGINVFWDSSHKAVLIETNMM